MYTGEGCTWGWFNSIKHNAPKHTQQRAHYTTNSLCGDRHTQLTNTQVVREVPKFLTIVTFPPQTLLFDMGHPSDGVFFILSGRVVCQVMQSGVRLRQPV